MSLTWEGKNHFFLPLFYSNFVFIKRSLIEEIIQDTKKGGGAMVRVLVNEEFGFRYYMFFFLGTMKELEEKWAKNALRLALPVSNWWSFQHDEQLEKCIAKQKQGMSDGLIVAIDHSEELIVKAEEMAEAFIDL